MSLQRVPWSTAAVRRRFAGWFVGASLGWLLTALPEASLLAASKPSTGPVSGPSDPAVAERLRDFDGWMQKTMKDWNAPGIGVAIVVGDQVVLSRGWGYRDLGEKLPFTSKTVVPIASNTKLFTSVAAGLAVADGLLTWDEPIRKSVPQIRFHDDSLDASITLRDMLAHRTGITRHDTIWYKSDFTRRELFDRLRYLEPKEPPRTLFLYNNMMYAGAGYALELATGKTWEDNLRERLFGPLGMTSTVFSIADMTRQSDFGVPYTERRDSFELYKIPYYEEAAGMGPAGSINSNLEDMSHWLTALLNEGRFGGRQVIPADVLRATLAPAIALPNATLETRGWGELLNSAYGMGRWTASYRGNLVAYHGGDINGFHSQVAMAPRERIGVIVLVVGDHAAPLYNVVAWNVLERLLGLSQTPWRDRILEIRLKGKEAAKAARAGAGSERIAGTKPAHPLDDYQGEFEHPAYGVVRIGSAAPGSDQESALTFDFHKIHLPLTHFHFDRFDSPDDEQDGKWSVNFQTSPQGEVDRAVMSLDEAEVVFTRRAATELADPKTLAQYAGTYTTPSGGKFQVVLDEQNGLGIAFPGAPVQKLVPWKPHRFRIPEFSDITIEFVVEGGAVTAMRQIDPSAAITFPRQ